MVPALFSVAVSIIIVFDWNVCPAPSKTCPAAPIVFKVKELDADTFKLPASIVELPACSNTVGATIEVEPRLRAAPDSTSARVVAVILLLLVIALFETTLNWFQVPLLLTRSGDALLLTIFASETPAPEVCKLKDEASEVRIALGPLKSPILPESTLMLSAFAFMFLPAD